MLRYSLWNTYGKEILKINKNKIEYIADYNWFKDKVKDYEFETVYYTIENVGYEVENKGVLVANFNNGNTLTTVTKIDLNNLNNLIIQLNS